ncbi:RluA family pseudouridine synthase [Leptospira ognonensis]|uniref:RluA family pseudouridine synthase n=1 Tax=Leptospira ognonensis TaxID=2484945 RepID=UPI0014383248|nr:RluA family pseudouridine synthase [Leptospira ognonensis]
MKAYKSNVPDTFHSLSVLEYLLKRFPYHSEEEWTLRILQNQVLVNESKVPPRHILTKGDEVAYLPLDLSRGEPPINIEYTIVYENSDFLVVNKPPNIPVHPSGRYRTHTLLNLLENERGIGTCFPVHRLDRETSGVMIFAKKKSYQLMLQTLFEQRLVQKHYRIFVFGEFPQSVKAEGFIGPDKTSEIRKKQRYHTDQFENAKFCITEFNLISYHPAKLISYLEVKPATGRIHQIRATLLSLGYPVVGDKLYGIRETAFLDFVNHGETKSLSKELGHSRQALHATEISFFDSISETDFHFSAPISQDLISLVVSNP